MTQEIKPVCNYTEDLSFDYLDSNAPAMFTPSLSRMYVIHAGRYDKKMPAERKPAGMHSDGRELNFLREDSASFYYPYALTSAGHANLDFEREDAAESEQILNERDKKKTIIIGDSGGYQIGKGIMKFDWDNFDSAKNDELRLKIIKWLEHSADISMTLDVPVWGVGGKLKGVDTFEDCLIKTLHNHDYFIKHRTPGATRFANILHGRNWEECEIWWDAVKDLPFEAWAIGSAAVANFEYSMKRLIIMRDGGYLDKERNWMHFLGVSRFTSACAYSSIQKAIRQHVEPTFTISYDASSPFLSTAKGSVYSRLNYTSKQFGFSTENFLDNKLMSGSTEPFPMMTAIGKKLKMGDICVKGFDKESQSSWDTWTYVLLMNHNCYMHTRGLMEANRLYNLPHPSNKPFIPSTLIEFKDFCEEIFTTDKPMDLIEKHKKLLMNISGQKTENRRLSAIKSSGFFKLEDEIVYDDVVDISNEREDED